MVKTYKQIKGMMLKGLTGLFKASSFKSPKEVKEKKF